MRRLSRRHCGHFAVQLRAHSLIQSCTNSSRSRNGISTCARSSLRAISLPERTIDLSLVDSARYYGLRRPLSLTVPFDPARKQVQGTQGPRKRLAVLGEEHVLRLRELSLAFEVQVKAKPGKPGEFDIACDQECDQTFQHPHELAEWNDGVSESDCNGEGKKRQRDCQGGGTGCGNE
jgi:hypothetical protein